MQIPFLQLTVIISGAVASPLAQFYPDDSFDIALSDNLGVATPQPFQIAGTDTTSQAQAQNPPETLPNVPQPGDPILRQKPTAPTQTPDENNPEEGQKNINQPFECGAGKSGACCVGGTRDGITSGCIRFLVYDDWCQNPESFKCCNSQSEKDSQIEKGLALEDHYRVDCEDPKEVVSKPQHRWGENLLRMIIPQGGGIESGVSLPKGVWLPNQ